MAIGKHARSFSISDFEKVIAIGMLNLKVKNGLILKYFLSRFFNFGN